ncbi:MAG: hypothetical protein WBB08_04985 [Halobacteriota archaeon]
MKSMRNGRGRSCPTNAVSVLSGNGKRRMLNFRSKPRKSPSGGRRSSQGRFRMSATSEAMTNERRVPTGTFFVILLQDCASHNLNNSVPRAFKLSDVMRGCRVRCSNRILYRREKSRTACDSAGDKF